MSEKGSAERMADKDAAERAAAAQKVRDEGDPRPASQIEQETMAQQEAGQPVTDPLGRDDSQLGAAARGDQVAGEQALRDHAVRDQQARDQQARDDAAKGEKDTSAKGKQADK